MGRARIVLGKTARKYSRLSAGPAETSSDIEAAAKQPSGHPGGSCWCHPLTMGKQFPAIILPYCKKEEHTSPGHPSIQLEVTEEKLVWSRAFESNGEMRTRRCTPASVFSQP